jgi:hypothetical protein
MSLAAGVRKLENEGAPTVISARSSFDNEALGKFVVNEILGRLWLESDERDTAWLTH